MRIIYLMVWKELLQIFRNRTILPLLTVMPIVQLLLLTNVATNEVKQLNVAIDDQDHSAMSRQLLDKLSGSAYFQLQGVPDGDADVLLRSGEADAVLRIPSGFERSLRKEQSGDVQLLVNAINGTKGNLAYAYSLSLIQDYNREINLKIGAGPLNRQPGGPGLSTISNNWYNPELDYKTFMVPGILGELVTILILVLTAMNIVREREIGAIEQINVTPIKRYQFILGKLIPFLLLGLFDLALGLAIGKLVFDIPLVGNLGLVFAFCVLNLIVVLSMGLLISTTADTQQQAIFVAWFFMMIFILMSGLFTPIESMPQWAQYLTYPNPVAHFVEVMRRVLLKGSTFTDIQWQFAVTAILAVIFSTLAVLSYRKTA